MKKLFYNGIIHTMVSEDDCRSYMVVEDGKITETGEGEAPVGKYPDRENLEGRHVYPCLIDGHVHMLETIAVMAMGYSVCEITSDGIQPHSLAGVEKRVRAYAEKQKPDAIIALNNYVLTAIDEKRMPNREELDDWAGGRAIVIYNIDGHSTALSSRMLEMIGTDPETSDGILQGEDNERAQGRLIDIVGSSVSLPVLAKGIARFHNYCAEYGINIVAALEGNGDSKKDATTKLIVQLARRFDMKIRLYLQYTDIGRVEPFRKYMKKPRVGGCGDWEMDGATGSHSSAFRTPFLDTGRTAPCYFTQEQTDALVKAFSDAGYQIASHAIGECAIEQLLNSLDKADGCRFNRIEHCEFHDDAAFERLAKGRYALMMQPGYAWIDKRYLHTYEQFLPKEICDRLKFKKLYDAGICLCGSSDSPCQDMDPYQQMLGMTQFYNEEESVTPYEAMVTYTKNPARALEEDDEFGTLEEGKTADFFTADRDFFRLSPMEVAAFRPVQTYYGGIPYIEKKGTVAELVRMMLKKPQLI